MTREESISRALEEKEQLLKKETAHYEALIDELSDENPEFLKTVRELSATGARLAITALGGDENKFNALTEKLKALSEKKKEMLKAAGIGAIKYECEKCRDTGYIDGKLCECVKKRAKNIILSGMQKTVPLDKCSFENFDLAYYKDPSAQKRMTAILKLCREFALGFNGNTAENLLFMGNTGLGKTHLSLSIASEVIKKGYNVVYGSAYNLFSEMESEHFAQHTNKRYENVIACDLLIIDDLGGEFVSPYIQSLIYNIVNTRLLYKKPTVISTNLSMQEIENIYTPRTASRLIGEYTAKKFLGEDIRQIKAFAEK